MLSIILTHFHAIYGPKVKYLINPDSPELKIEEDHRQIFERIIDSVHFYDYTTGCLDL